MITRTLEESLSELNEELQKKEEYLQSKEKKWMEIEEIMAEYAAEDEELREKFRDLRVIVRSNQPISNVVHLNEKLEKESVYYQMELKRLREILLDPKRPYDKLDDKNTSDKLKVIQEDVNALWKKVPIH